MKKIIILLAGAIIGVIVLNSCSYEDMMDKLVPKKEAKMAEDYLTKLRQRDFEYIKGQFSDEIRPKVTDGLLVQMADYFRHGELLSTQIIGSQVYEANGVWKGNFSFEYHFTDGWNLANAAFRKVGDKYEVIGLNVYQTKMSQKEYNAFKLSGKSPLQYLVLALAVFVPLFILVTTYFCIRTPMAKRKWLWIIFILLGVCAIRVNWTTGQFAIQLISVHLLGAGAGAASPYAPWIISASIPLGAILFWINRKRFIQLDSEAGAG